MDDSDGEVSRSGASSAKKRRLPSSSSESDETVHLIATESNVANDISGEHRTRSSERIQHRRNKSFSMPERNDIWDAIPTTKTPEKKHDGLKPRKLVNDFTRVTHRYNHDPAYTSDEGSSLDGFIEIEGELSIESSSSSSSDDYIPEVGEQFDGRKKKRKHRIKKRRLKQPSSDSGNDPNEPKVTVPSDRGGDVRALLKDKLLRGISVNGGSSNNKDKRAHEPCKTDSNVTTASDRIRGRQSRQLLVSSSDEEDSSRFINDRFKHRSRRKRQRKDALLKDICSDSNGEYAQSSEKICDMQTLSSSVSSGKEHGSQSSDDSEDEQLVGDTCVPTDGDDALMPVQRKSVMTISSDTDSSDSDSSDTDSDDTALGRLRNQTRVRTEKQNILFKDFMQARTKYESKTKSHS